MGDGTWLTVGEAVRRLRSAPKPLPISEQTVRRMADRGDLATLKVGRHRRILAKAVDALKDRMWAEAYPEGDAEPGPAEP